MTRRRMVDGRQPAIPWLIPGARFEVGAGTLEAGVDVYAAHEIAHSGYGAKPCRVRTLTVPGAGSDLVVTGYAVRGGRVVSVTVWRTTPRTASSPVRVGPTPAEAPDGERGYQGIPVTIRGRRRSADREAIITGPELVLIPCGDQALR